MDYEKVARELVLIVCDHSLSPMQGTDEVAARLREIGPAPVVDVEKLAREIRVEAESMLGADGTRRMDWMPDSEQERRFTTIIRRHLSDAGDRIAKLEAERDEFKGETVRTWEVISGLRADLAASEAENKRLRGLVETCWQYCGGAKPGPSFDEMHAELYHYMHDIGRVGSAKAALSGDQKEKP